MAKRTNAKSSRGGVAVVFVIAVVGGVWIWHLATSPVEPGGSEGAGPAVGVEAGGAEAGAPRGDSEAQGTVSAGLGSDNSPAGMEAMADQVASGTALAAEESREPASEAGGTVATAAARRAQVLYEEGYEAFERGDMYEASQLLTLALEAGLGGQNEVRARGFLNGASDQWLFSRKVYEGVPHTTTYRVKSGDYLTTIAKRYDVPYELIMRINGITNARSLRMGQTLKVVQGPFHVRVDRSDFQMEIVLGDVIVRNYPVGLGAVGRETPTGLWRVSLKQPNPEWVDPDTGRKYLPNDPENPLGDHWIAMDGLEGNAVGRTGFGIHGTSKPEEIGKRASRGCIRLHNGNAAEVYDLLVPKKSLVRVVD